jgi:DNA-binding response OmpR family regulator
MISRLLIIEDNRNIQELLRINFTQEDFWIIQAFDGEDGLDKAKQLHPDLIILDINLPKMKGTEVCKVLKNNNDTKQIPVIMLTVRKDEVDRILGFEIGADDYVTKPFSIRELILRVKAVLHRNKQEPTKVRIKAGDVFLDESSFEVFVGKKSVSLTAMEFKLLRYFLLNKERVLSRNTLLNNVWGYNSDIDTRTVDAHIKSLRKKLPTKKLNIRTLIGIGYKLTEDV